MNNKIDNILYKVEKPSRYIGDEINSYNKEITPDTIRYGFAFPDVYEVGMSHMGLHILYNLLNEKENVYCERVFSPAVDMEEELRKNDIPLFTLETQTDISKLDFLGFTLQYELSFTNILNMLDMASIPLRSKDRDESHPIVMAGGPCAYNPEPIAEIVDVFVIGEAEDVIFEILDEYKKDGSYSRKEFLKAIAPIHGVYVPSLYEATYNEDGTIKEFKPLIDGLKSRVKKRVIKDLDDVFFPETMLVPYLDVVHDRARIEIFRGCARGCRFCQAGMIYRPVRERSLDKVLDIADKQLKATGYEEMSIASLSTSDYSSLDKLTRSLMDKYLDKKIGLSLPSLRLDSISLDVIEEIQKVRKTGLTFAPEAGTQRLRDVINKGVVESDLTKVAEDAFSMGWSTVKLYFMVGLPTERYDDLDGIADLARKVVKIYRETPKENRHKGLKVTVSTSSFVPKAFTPFQWEPQDTMEVLREKQFYLKDILKIKCVKYSYHDNKTSQLEAVFARGDRRLNEVIIKAFEKGCKFDGWNEHFKYDEWIASFEELGIDPNFYATRRREYDELLPWDFIDIGVTKDFLINESKRANSEELTMDCRDGCASCGVNTGFLGGMC